MLRGGRECSLQFASSLAFSQHSAGCAAVQNIEIL